MLRPRLLAGRGWPSLCRHLPPELPPARALTSSAAPAAASLEGGQGCDRRRLAAYPLVRCLPHQPPSVRLSKEEQAQMASAGSFFQHHGRFLYSAEALHHHAVNLQLPEVVLLGASNVGKSTFLNALLGQSGIARVSQRPGRTRLMNAYGVGPRPKPSRQSAGHPAPPPDAHSLVLVDTPGYGFRSQPSWGQAILRYLEARTMLRGAVLLLSSEKKLLAADKWLLQTLARAKMRTLVVLTKADKGPGDGFLRCTSAAAALVEEMRLLDASVGGGWLPAIDQDPVIYITAAGMDRSGKLGNGGGIGGVRAAILHMAGFALQHAVSPKAETAQYSGPTISFDDIVYRST